MQPGWTGGHARTGLGTGVIDFVASPVFAEQGPPALVAEAKAAWAAIEAAKAGLAEGRLQVAFNGTL